MITKEQLKEIKKRNYRMRFVAPYDTAIVLKDVEKLIAALEAERAEIAKLHRFMDVMDHDMLTDHYPYFECPHERVNEDAMCLDCGAIILEKR